MYAIVITMSTRIMYTNYHVCVHYHMTMHWVVRLYQGHCLVSRTCPWLDHRASENKLSLQLNAYIIRFIRLDAYISVHIPYCRIRHTHIWL